MIHELHRSHVTDIVELLRILRAESPEYNYVDDDPVWVANNMDGLIQNATLVGVVSEDDDAHVTGFMIGFVSHTWYSKRVDAMEQLLYVHPLYRGGSLAPRLIKRFEELCRTKGAFELSVGASTGMAEERTVKLYKHMGYTERSPTLVKRL